LMCCWDRRGYVLGRARAADVSRELRGPPVEEIGNSDKIGPKMPQTHPYDAHPVPP